MLEVDKGDFRRIFFDSVCILNDSFDSGDYFPLVSGSSTNLVFNLNIYANVFSNTNRTNLTNLVGRDMVYIRGIREITSLWSVGLRQISWST